MRFGVIHGLLVTMALGPALLLLAACEEEEGPPATPTETPTAETPVTEEGAAELQELAGATEAITAKVTYNLRSTFQGQTMEGTWTLVQRPPDSRIDFSGTQEGQTFTTVIINAGGMSYWCSEVAGQGQCLSVPATTAEEQSAIFEPFFETTRALEEEAEAFERLETFDRSIAGVDAKCWRVKGTAEAGFQEAEVCFSEEGILLLSRTSAPEGDFSIEATEVTRDVTDADFEPPYEVTELPGD